MPPKREIKQLFHGDDSRVKIMAGAKQMFEAVSSVYGPGSQNALLGMPYGAPVLTRDGVTVAKRVVLKDRAENDAAQVMYQASEKTNKTAGDGTTTTVVLAYYLLSHAHQQVMAVDESERSSLAMKLKRQMLIDAKTVTDYLSSKSESSEGHLLEVATVSSGDVSIGGLVADTMLDIGPEGGITIREQSYPIVDVEKVNGYYFDRGFFALNQQVEYQKPLIFVTQKRLASQTDMLPILNAVVNGDNKKLVIVGDVSGDALNLAIMNSVQGNVEVVIVPPPRFGEESKLFMEDIATYVGSNVFVEAENPVTAFRFRVNAQTKAPLPEDIRAIQERYFGSAERVQVNQERAIIFGGAGDGDAIATRAAQIKEQIDVEGNAHKKEQLEGRYSKLVGKIAIVNVGGSTPTEMEELRFRVEDAIEATKSAMQDGVLPGGGTMLVKAANLTHEPPPSLPHTQMSSKISPLFKSALESTFKKLMTNAAESADYRLTQVQKAKFGYGFNLRDMTDEPVDLQKAGIWDATRAIIQTVENAASAAGALLTVGTIIAVEDDDEKTKA